MYLPPILKIIVIEEIKQILHLYYALPDPTEVFVENVFLNTSTILWISPLLLTHFSLSDPETIRNLGFLLTKYGFVTFTKNGIYIEILNANECYLLYQKFKTNPCDDDDYNYNIVSCFLLENEKNLNNKTSFVCQYQVKKQIGYRF